MNDPFSESRLFRILKSVKRILGALLAVAVFGLVVVLHGYWFLLASKSNAMDEMETLAIVSTLIPLLLFIFSLFLRSARSIRFYVVFMLVLILIFGVFAIQKPFLGLLPAALLALSLCAFFILNQLPPFVFAAVFTAGGIGIFLITTAAGNAGQNPFPNPSNFLANPIGSVLFPSILMGCAYIPRRLQWKRYFSPHATPLPRRYDGGFTLIELLISIAILGIITGGVIHSWGSIIQSQKVHQARLHVTEILNSQMNALMAVDLPPASDDKHDLPIQFSEFVTPLKLSGHYTVMETDAPGLIRIEIAIEWEIEAPVERGFRLIGYRWIEEGALP